MSAQHKSGIKKYAVAVLFLVLMLGLNVNASAATWKLNANGTYSCYENGKLVRNKWITQNGNRYYVNSNGIRQTGWLLYGGKWYFFIKSSGALLKNSWLTSEKKVYCAGADGAMYAGGMRRINSRAGSFYYAFSARGVRMTGLHSFSGKTYFFETKADGKRPDQSCQGRMVTAQWRSWKKKQYYFTSSGAAAKNQRVGLYYVDKNGARIKNEWRDKRYYGSTGKAVSGLQKIDGVYYYFSTKTYQKVTNTTIKIGGVTYTFDSTGKGTVKQENKAPATSVNVERTYYTDKYVDDETLLASIIYCEAGNQPYTGQLAVGLVIMNRVYDSRFPSKLREVVYQRWQFSPTFDGALTRAINSPSLVTASCKKAAKEVMRRMQTYQKGAKVYLNMNGKNTLFPHLFFMTPAAYRRLGLSARYVRIGGHVFFTNWC